MKFGKSNKILIIGNSGSGKSWLAGNLALHLELEQFALDELRWEKGGFYTKRPDEEVFADLTRISDKPNFAIEGVYGDLADFLKDKVSHLIWLDIDPDKCAESVVARGFENIPWMDSEKKINAYLKHIRSYTKGLGPMSRTHHEQIFNSFDGNKMAFRVREEVTGFVSTLKS